GVAEFGGDVVVSAVVALFAESAHGLNPFIGRDRCHGGVALCCRRCSSWSSLVVVLVGRCGRAGAGGGTVAGVVVSTVQGPAPSRLVAAATRTGSVDRCSERA